jgi:leader peptidase (prepilin peptidase)/N-methyltransferase
MNTVLVLIGLVGLGMIFGSFVNALVWRLYKKRDWVSERSECTHCHHALAPKDLIPVVSWLMLKGKCRYCHKKIEDTSLPELLTPALFIASFVWWPTAIEGVGLFQFITWLVIVILFVALIVYDLRWMELPNKIVFPVIALAALYVLIPAVFYHYPWDGVLDAGLGSLLISGIFYLLFQLSQGTWIGGGDVKLAIALGLLAGDPLRACLLLFFASLIGTVVALPKIIKEGMRPKIEIPFGPLLIAGTILVYLFGTPIVNWYTNMLTV